MKMWVVMESDYDYGIPRGVYSSPEKAKIGLRSWQSKDRSAGYEICEFEVDGDDGEISQIPKFP